MASLTIDVTDDVAQTIASLPDKDRAEYLADVNAFATAAAKQRSKRHAPDEAPLTPADAQALREAFAAFDAGDRGKSAAQSFALVAARLGLKNTPL